MYKPVRLSLRFVIPLLIAVGIFAYGALPLADRLMLRWFSRDLETRSESRMALYIPMCHNEFRDSIAIRADNFEYCTAPDKLFAGPVQNHIRFL